MNKNWKSTAGNTGASPCCLHPAPASPRSTCGNTTSRSASTNRPGVRRPLPGPYALHVLDAASGLRHAPRWGHGRRPPQSGLPVHGIRRTAVQQDRRQHRPGHRALPLSERAPPVRPCPAHRAGREGRLSQRAARPLRRPPQPRHALCAGTGRVSANLAHTPSLLS